MPHPLPNQVLLELGKFTWEAIELEGYVDTVCSFIRYTNAREDRRSIGQKVKDARGELRTWPDSAHTAPVDEWLSKASDALESRNAVLHGTVLAQIDRDRAVIGYAIGEMPRKGRPYFERELSVGGVKAVRKQLEQAGRGWIEALHLAASLHP